MFITKDSLVEKKKKEEVVSRGRKFVGGGEGADHDMVNFDDQDNQGWRRDEGFSDEDDISGDDRSDIFDKDDIEYSDDEYDVISPSTAPTRKDLDDVLVENPVDYNDFREKYTVKNQYAEDSDKKYQVSYVILTENKSNEETENVKTVGDDIMTSNQMKRESFGSVCDKKITDRNIFETLGCFFLSYK